MRSALNLARLGRGRLLAKPLAQSLGKQEPGILKGCLGQLGHGRSLSRFLPRGLGGVVPSRVGAVAAQHQQSAKHQELAARAAVQEALKQQSRLGQEIFESHQNLKSEVESQKNAPLESNAMVFEVGISFLVSHYVHIGISICRCLFQVFRPILIAFIFGQILKAVFFAAGVPVWFSFYSIWMFEVFYGLGQCIISFIFVCFFYNNLSFQKIRPMLQSLRSQGRLGLETAMRVAQTAQQEKSPIARVLPNLKPSA